MGLDPIIANPAKMPDPLTQYNNALVVAQGKMGIDKVKREEADLNALGAVYKDSQGDRTQMRNHLINRGLGRMLPTIEKGWAELDEATAKGDKLKAETTHEGVKQQKTAAEAGEVGQKAFEKALENHTKKVARISHDPAVGTGQIKQWLTEMFADTLMGPSLKARGETLEGALAELDATLKSTPYPIVLAQLGVGMGAATKQNVTRNDLGNRVEIISTPEHSIGAPKPTVISNNAVGASPNAPKTTVNVTSNAYVSTKGDTSYTEEWNKRLAGDDHGLKTGAGAAPDLIRRADRIDAILKSGKVITGVGAPLRLGWEKTLGLVGAGDKEAIKNTEVLGVELAKTTLEHVKTSGLAGSSGLTEGERGYLERAVAGQIMMDNESLQEIARLSRKQATSTIEKWKVRDAEIRGTNIQGRAYPQTTPTVPPAPARPRSNDKGFQENVRKLKAGQITKAVFDKYYGPGAAASMGVK